MDNKRDLKVLRRHYVSRAIGMVFFTIVVGSSYFEQEKPVFFWLVLLGNAFLWPHVGYWIAKRSRNPMVWELRLMSVDSLLAGYYIATMGFSLWPTVAALGGNLVSNVIAVGVRKQLTGLALSVAGAGVTTALLGFPVHTASGWPATIAGVLFIFAYLAITSRQSHSMVLSLRESARKLTEKNQRIQELLHETESSRKYTSDLLGVTAAARAETELLAAMARSANEGSSLSDVLLAVDSAVRQRIGSITVGLYLADATDSRLELRVLFVDGSILPSSRLPVELQMLDIKTGPGSVQRSIRKKRLIQFPRGAGKRPDPLDAGFNQLWSHSWMLHVPLVLSKRVIGLLVLTSRNTAPVSRKDREFLQRVSDQIAGIVRTTEKLVEKEQMATIGDMAAGIVHDLKNPVGIIKGSVELADDDSLGRAERRSMLQIIGQEADRMLALVQDLLDFSRGSLSITKQRTECTAYLARVQAVIAPIFAGRDIRVSVTASYSGELRIDPDRFLRVLVNLAGNAADALAAGGSFAIEAGRQNGHITFTLSDTGPGIPEKIRETLFEPFVTYGKAHGTGLGMAIAKSMVEAHGGTISFETETGKGTTFTIEVPA